MSPEKWVRLWAMTASRDVDLSGFEINDELEQAVDEIALASKQVTKSTLLYGRRNWGDPKEGEV